MPNVQRRSRRQEQAAADRLGGRRTPGSGAGWMTKNDVKTDDLSVEIKYTDKKSYPLKHADLKTAESHALMDSGRDFAFIVGFGEVRGSAMVIQDEYVIVSRPYFEALREQARGNPE